MGREWDSNFWEQVKRSKEQERDRAREAAQQASEASEQERIQADDKAWGRDMQNLLGAMDGKTSDKDAERMLNETFRRAGKRGYKPTPAQKNAARRAAQQRRRQGGGCSLVALAMLASVVASGYGLWELL